MAHILLDNVSVEFPILHGGHRSLKKSLVARATGGAILQEAHSAPVVRALSNISLSFQAGDRVALIGPNGAGKTTLLRVLGGVYEPSRGYVHTDGRVMTLLDLGLGFNADMTGRENVVLKGMYMGLRPREIRAIAPEIEAFTELGEYLDMPIRTYSSGMLVRLSFAVATCIQPDILLMDEWVLAGDAAFAAKARARMERFVEGSRILVLASHLEATLTRWCNKAVLLWGGELCATGDVLEVLAAYEERRRTAAAA